MPLGSGALAAAHGRLWWLGRGLVPDKGGNVRAAGALKLGRDGSRAAARGSVVAEVRFKASGDGFESDVRPAVVQGLPVRADMRDYKMVVRMRVGTASGLPGMLPEHMGVVFRAEGGEDAGDGFLPLFVRQRLAR